MVHIPGSQVGIVVAKTLILVIGGLITYYSFQAYRRTDMPEHRLLAVGFGIVTVGAIAGGIFDIFLSMYYGEDLLYTSVFISSTLTAVGLAVILYSLYVR